MKKKYKYILGIAMASATMFTCSSSHELCPAYTKSPIQQVEKI
ncbi:MAG: hypothetical protein ACO3EE_06665 [Flavobacteriales bacterium]